ncbi:hypothetical protein BGZ61DRAFT_515295 [Ilyonectria robusta]|uniref:uncharacterized protein n=1 Tax=Ilyonectria robusta TaxID=1079257 RepID=UPI001E8EB3D6|nr:uncharacterized protein BGZ61DRAFT_515295 [Ilyonectria robusta]KAH8734174.1 hypothetical protein BGZ61DRAFT_515295 [Ilyonectria robusta]
MTWTLRSQKPLVLHDNLKYLSTNHDHFIQCEGNTFTCLYIERATSATWLQGFGAFGELTMMDYLSLVFHSASTAIQAATNDDIFRTVVNDLDPLGNELWLCNIDYYEDAPIGIYGCDNLEHSGDDQQGQLTVAGYHNSDHILFNTPAECSAGQQYRPHTAHELFNDHNLSLLLSPSTHPDLSSLNPIVFSDSRASWSPETRPGPSIPSNFLPSPTHIDKPTEIPESITSAFVYCQRCPRKFPSKHELDINAQLVDAPVFDAQANEIPNFRGLFVTDPINARVGSFAARTKLDSKSTSDHDGSSSVAALLQICAKLHKSVMTVVETGLVEMLNWVPTMIWVLPRRESRDGVGLNWANARSRNSREEQYQVGLFYFRGYPALVAEPLIFGKLDMQPSPGIVVRFILTGNLKHLVSSVGPNYGYRIIIPAIFTTGLAPNPGAIRKPIVLR